MAGYREIVDAVVSELRRITGVPVYHAPAPSAGEKIIYRYTPGESDGVSGEFVLTLRFISRDLAEAMARAEAVETALCSRGDRGVVLGDGISACIRRRDGSGSGFIGKTGHFFILSRLSVRFRCTEGIRSAEGRTKETEVITKEITEGM